MKDTAKRRKGFDLASKEIIKGENIRAGLVKYLIEDYKNLPVEKVKELVSDVLPSDDLSLPGKKVSYDVLFTVKLPNRNEKVGIYVDVEPQGYKEKDERLLNRAFYYCSRLIDKQNGLKEGFERRKYEEIKKFIPSGS